MKRSIQIICILIMVCCAGSAYAGFIDFENGYDDGTIASSITGLEFTNTAGYDWVYGDWRTNDYNGKYPNYSIVNDWDWPRPIASQFFSDGNIFAWMGAKQGIGVISFTQAYATYFRIGYSTSSGIDLKAFDELGSQLDADYGVMNNTGTGQLGYLEVNAPGMAYVTLAGTENNWLVDNLETDAIQECILDEHCDDGVFCNGAETCANYTCLEADPVVCADDDIFCNGTESCSETDQACVHSGDPCAPEECDEQTDSCPAEEEEEEEEPDSGLEDDDDSEELPEEDEDLWPEGKVTGGCGC